MGKIRYSRIGPILGRMYEMLTSEKVLIVKRYNVLFELSNRIPGERAILFYAYEPKVTDIFLSLLDEGDIVIDAGAWIGYYASSKYSNPIYFYDINPHSYITLLVTKVRELDRNKYK